MTKPAKGAEVLLIIFGLVFASAGLFFASSLLFGAPGQVQGNRWAGVLVSTVFILVGGGLVGGAIYGVRKLKEQAAVEQANPESPWLWRKDWAARRAESKNRNRAIGLWLAAILANAIAFAVAAAAVPKLWRTSNPAVIFPLLFCVVGIVVAVVAIRASIRRKRFGQTYFEFASLPFSPGQPLQGAIHLRFNSDAQHGVDLSLSCVRQVTTGSGDNRSTYETVLWQADKNVPQAFLMPGPMGDATIPVDFNLPSDAYESYHDQPDDKILWLLHAQADVPGVNYTDDFEVPVFRLTPSPLAASVLTASFSNGAHGGIATPAVEADASDVPAPPNRKVVVTVGMNGGAEFYFPPFRNPSRVLTLLLFTFVWTGILYFIKHSQAPWIFGAVFGFFELLLIYALIQSALGSFRIEVGNGRIVLRRALLGIGTARQIPIPDIAQILPVTTAQQKGVTASYSLCLYTRDGRKLTLADAIENRQEARWVAAQLEIFAGLKLDTHVAVRAGFGAGGPPPQRGPASSRSSVAVPPRSSAVAAAVGLAFFCAWIGFVGYQIFSHGHRRTNRVSKIGAPAKSPLRQMAYSPLTDGDVQHLQTLPEQARAEELLDRAIQHDPRALDLFERNIGSWPNLTRTARMSELERRSCYSTDLRVRYANVDLNLAIDGLPKTDSSADQLIALAQSDPEHRAYSVYHLGMLAGRGVAYDRIYPLLADYARNDTNPQVRQWAVEGLRYLGTDEALAQLFDSFTHDPSTAVRERAGCNVSDCGIFRRSQRMRMAPRLIQLAADPQTSPQMRNWTFLALHEITGQTLPADASAWQDWYAQHGAEKMAEFEQLDWWKVRGDQ